ncbi:methyltransferase domain-containing protein [Clavibacter zhangzhiyongii]|uniref:methyltransferase domain-containing protein n=1 Tax=Clavibacter zhangzhiyongii TaxID=2768071 RepID=UPI0039E124A5
MLDRLSCVHRTTTRPGGARVDLIRLASWLRCPTCGEELNAIPRSCSAVIGVTPSMPTSAGTRPSSRRARASSATPRRCSPPGTASWSGGTTPPIVDALSEAVGAGIATGRPPEPLRIVDAGCGTGHYLRALLDRLPGSVGLAADLSPSAVAIAVRGRSDVDGVVADTWAALPLRDGTADLILDVFAPRNLPEFHRALAPGGRVAIVAAGPGHLAELHAAGRAVGVQGDKRERILDAADPLFERISEARVHRVLRLTEDDVALLLGMGPSAHHPVRCRRPRGTRMPVRTSDRGTRAGQPGRDGRRHDPCPPPTGRPDDCVRTPTGLRHASTTSRLCTSRAPLEARRSALLSCC